MSTPKLSDTDTIAAREIREILTPNVAASKDAFTVTMKDGVKLACIKEVRGSLGWFSTDDNTAQVKQNTLSDGFVVLLHGRLHTKSRGPMAAIQPLLPYNTIALDARGMGESEGETGYSNMQEEVDDLKQVLEFLQPAHPILALVGHSKGAVVALTYAAQYPTPCSLVINVSGRYDASNLQATQSRFTPAQLEQLEKEGSFIWMNYRVGPEPDRPFRRPFKVTKEAVEHHTHRKLDCVRNIPQGIQILSLHGRADGTVPWQNQLRLDEEVQRGQASNDLMLLEGVAHNWDAPGQPELLASLVSSWIATRTKAKAQRGAELIDHLGIDRGRLSGAATPVPLSATPK